jgi:uncharacterized UPF0160 family protein
VFDVDSVFDAQSCRFDHHQIGAPARSCGTPLSSAGLIWQGYGERAVAALLAADSVRFVRQSPRSWMNAW